MRSFFKLWSCACFNNYIVFFLSVFFFQWEFKDEEYNLLHWNLTRHPWLYRDTVLSTGQADCSSFCLSPINTKKERSAHGWKRWQLSSFLYGWGVALRGLTTGNRWPLTVCMPLEGAQVNVKMNTLIGISVQFIIFYCMWSKSANEPAIRHDAEKLQVCFRNKIQNKRKHIKDTIKSATLSHLVWLYGSLPNRRHKQKQSVPKCELSAAIKPSNNLVLQSAVKSKIHSFHLFFILLFQISLFLDKCCLDWPPGVTLSLSSYFLGVFESKSWQSEPLDLPLGLMGAIIWMFLIILLVFPAFLDTNMNVSGYLILLF